MAPQIELDDSLLIGTGNQRQCYYHPQHPEYCIKIHLPKGNKNSTRKEIHYLRSIHWQPHKRPLLAYLSDFHGTVETNRGTGFIYDLARNADGTTAKELRFYLNEKADDPVFMAKLQQCYQQLKQVSLQYALVSRELKAYNTAVCLDLNQQPEKLMLIDNLGSPAPLPISHYISYFARRKLRQRFNKFESKPQHLALYMDR